MHHARSFLLSWVCIKGISQQFMVPSHSWRFTLTVFPMCKKKTRLKLHMCLNNNGVQKVNFFLFCFSFLILVENSPHPIFVVSCFFVIFIKAVLFCLCCEWIYSIVGCVLSNCLFFCFSFSWLYKKWWHVLQLTSI